MELVYKKTINWFMILVPAVPGGGSRQDEQRYSRYTSLVWNTLRKTPRSTAGCSSFLQDFVSSARSTLRVICLHKGRLPTKKGENVGIFPKSGTPQFGNPMFVREKKIMVYFAF